MIWVPQWKNVCVVSMGWDLVKCCLSARGRAIRRGPVEFVSSYPGSPPSRSVLSVPEDPHLRGFPRPAVLRAIFRIFRTISTPLLALLNRAMLPDLDHVVFDVVGNRSCRRSDHVPPELGRLLLRQTLPKIALGAFCFRDFVQGQRGPPLWVFVLVVFAVFQQPFPQSGVRALPSRGIVAQGENSRPVHGPPEGPDLSPSRSVLSVPEDPHGDETAPPRGPGPAVRLDPTKCMIL